VIIGTNLCVARPKLGGILEIRGLGQEDSGKSPLMVLTRHKDEANIIIRLSICRPQGIGVRGNLLLQEASYTYYVGV
jgi:hypothetical protein